MHRVTRKFAMNLVLVVGGSLVATSTFEAKGSKARAELITTGSAAPTPWERYGGWPDKRWDAFNTLRELKSPPLKSVPVPPEPITGDAAKGQALAFDRSRGGSCVACHVMGSKTPELPGNVGPDLSSIGTQRDAEFLYRYTYDARSFNPATVMPPWGTHELFSDQEIRDIVAFLKTLDAPAKFSDPIDNPAQRPIPKETRDNLDSFENPAMNVIEEAQRLYSTAGARGKSCADCHSDPAKQFKTWAAGMPRYEARMKKVLGVEEFVTRHAQATTGASMLMSSNENVAMSIYLRHLANGAPIKVDITSQGAKEAAKRGQELMNRKIGQLNFSCIDCHQKAANKWVRGQWLTESRGQTVHFPTWRTSRHEIWDLRKRFQWCNVAIRANELPPDAPEYGDIELYLTSLSSGLPLSVPGIRH